MNAHLLHRAGEARPYLWGWVLSVLLHAAVVGGAVRLLSDLQLAPQPEPFKWEVSFADAPAMEQGQEAGATAEAALATSAPVESLTEPGSGEPQPAAQPTQTIEQDTLPSHGVVKLEMPTSDPVERVSARPSETPNRTAEPPQPPAPAPTETAPPPEDRTTEGDLVASARRQTVAAPQSSASPEAPTASPPPTESPSTQPTVPELLQAKEITPSSAAPAPTQQVAAVERPAQPVSTKKADYGWLADTLWSRVEQLKRYPALARLNRLEGRVVLRVVIREDGHLEELAIAHSSGHAVLDQAAMETLREASPLALKHPLGKPQIVVQVPISYRLDR